MSELHWLDEVLPTPTKTLESIPGGIPANLPPEVVKHRRTLEVLKSVAYWPYNKPRHTHTVCLLRYTGAMRPLVEAYRIGNNKFAGLTTEEVGETLLDKAGGSLEGLRLSVVDICDGGESTARVQGLPPDRMDKFFRAEVLHQEAMGSLVFTDEVPPHTVNPFGTDTGGVA